jgi:hypothetical protein
VLTAVEPTLYPLRSARFIEILKSLRLPAADAEAQRQLQCAEAANPPPPFPSLRLRSRCRRYWYCMYSGSGCSSIRSRGVGMTPFSLSCR